MGKPQKKTPDEWAGGIRGRLSPNEIQRLNRAWAAVADVGALWGEPMLRTTLSRVKLIGCTSDEELEKRIKSATVMLETTLRNMWSSMKKSSE